MILAKGNMARTWLINVAKAGNPKSEWRVIVTSKEA